MSDQAAVMVSVVGSDGIPREARPIPRDASVVASRVPNLDPALVAQCEPLVAQLLFAGGQERFGIAVTSAISGEGVTSTCGGLAIALARSTEKDVLVVDANLRRPAVHALFNVGNANGLSDLVTAWASRVRSSESGEPSGGVGAGVRVTAIPNLFVLPSGATMDSPAPLITSDAMRSVVGALRARFGYVIIDCPPVLSSVEASSLCRLADGVVLVIRAGVTPRTEVAGAKARLAGTSLVGAVLNGM